MGQNNSRQSETINWNQIKTNDMSSTIPNLNGISREAQELISRLNLPEVSETNSEFNTNNILNINNLQNKNNKELITENANDDSSPFISSEMYNYIVNKYNNKSSNGNMVGGGADENMGDDSSTSATSSSLSNSDLQSSSSETDVKPKKVEHKKKDHKKKEHKKVEKKEESEDESEEVSEVVSEEEEEKHAGWKGKKGKASKGKAKAKSKYTGSEYLSYVSSSAHTGGSLTESVANENNYTISTVNTSDINMISE